MRVLITNIRLSSFSGTETVVELLAEGLRRRGHEPMLFSPSLGAQAARMRERGFIVADRVARLPYRPDVIHAQHVPVTLAALAAFPDAPAVFACHSSVFALEAPRSHPQIRKWIAVDELCRARCLSSGVQAEHVTVILNAVDLDRFARRAPLPPKPARALLLTKTTGHHEAVRAVCLRHGIALDELGAATGRVSAALETELPHYDLVFATARMALEAAAVGSAVVVCDGRGFAGALTSANLTRWRRWNLGLGLLTEPTTEAALEQALAAYDPDDAALVADLVRADASFLHSADQHIAVYEAALAAKAPAAAEVSAATAEWIEDLTPTGEMRPWRDLAHETFGIAAPPINAVLQSMERRICTAVDESRRGIENALAAAAAQPGARPSRRKEAAAAVHVQADGPRGYAICTTPRAGSNYLCQALASTGALGRPLEYFNGPARRTLDDPDYPDDPHAQAARVRADGATANGVYGVKLFPWQLERVLSANGAFAALTNLRFVRLRRRDRLGQAISWLRALQTGQYRSTQQPRAPIAYDGGAIVQRMLEIARAEASWDIYFAKAGVQPPSLVYEDIAADLPSAARLIADLVGVSGAEIEPRRIEVVPQRDAITEEWRARFIAEHGGLNDIQVLSASY